MKKIFFLKVALIVIFLGSNICFSKEKQYNNELEFSNSTAKKILHIGGNGNLNITGYKGDKILISADTDIFKKDDEVNEKAKGLKKIGGGGFNIINNREENIIKVLRPLDEGINLDIKVPNDITLKLGNGGVIKNQDLKDLKRELREQTRELREQRRQLREQKKQIEKNMQPAKKIPDNLPAPIPPIPVVTGFGQSNSILDGDIYIKDFKGTIEINTVDGSISADNIEGEVTASAVDGDISVKFKTLNMERTLYFSTVDGDIDITFPKNTKADILARTMEGDVYSGFDGDVIPGNEMENKADENDPQNFYNLFFNSNYITTRINGGGSSVYLNTIDGNIYIRKGE